MNNDRSFDPKRRLSDDIWDELASLAGKELDDYLKTIGFEPDELLRSYSSVVRSAVAAPKRARFEEARRLVSERQVSGLARVLTFDMARKTRILAAVRERDDASKKMTIAARNRKIDDENDLDVLLDACLKLGMIDDEGNLKD